MAILLNNEQPIDVDVELIERIARHVLDSEGVTEEAELSVALVDDARMRELNESYRGIPEPTDVLSFSMAEDEEEGEAELLGDVVIAPNVARSQAKELGHSFEAEMGLLLTHGVLHLLGYKHELFEDAARMEERERELLRPFFGSALDE